MTSLAEILILRGAVPIEALDRMTGDPARDEQWINELIDNEQVSPEAVGMSYEKIEQLIDEHLYDV